ncbi:MAG: RNase adapter RapZ, partial [Anaerovoracaceae bacterium]
MNDNVSGQMNVVIVTGLSGAGKTHAADWFEDKGYYCIDNMPPLLIKDFLELADYNNSRISKAAFVVDIRSEDFADGLKSAISYMRQAPGISYKILFIEASDETLIKRYNESRRRHPLSSGGMATSDVIERERAMMDGIRRDADYIIDTTNMKTAEFQHEMDRVMEGGSPANGRTKFSINIVSFGYKYGVPQDIDMAFDMRFIPNPFYIKSLKKLTGNNKKVQQ